ncbi:hypothetical protein K0H19_05855 [Phocaeicola vulgatus]|jgi:alanine--tRNA ligase|uniref:hypothetical protein n=1 Tax=Phocaeicola vulgatus TaxID=821 RepID=UPI001F472BD3|nr:hypothetical protein [Phocaeicola vulgatus]MCE9351691.1 hypothetical protein [Phocaeicola vulgatus]MDU7568139.1 hypothetical protein [Bacteroides sp.]
MEQPSLNDHNKQEYPPMHTTEHVINRTMVNLFGCGRAISAHIERKKSKLDFALQTCPEEADIIRIENTVNEVLRRNLPVTMEFISQEEAIGRFDMKRLPEKASETVRIVKVGDYDECLCIGQHVKNTSEIGTFKIISHDYKGGIFRMRFKLI